MIKNYIFDLGNVIAGYDPYVFTAKYINGEENIKNIAEIVFDRTYWNKLDLGTITDKEVKEGIAGRVPEKLKASALMVYDNWMNDLIPIKGIKEIISDLKDKGYKLYLLSNISIGFAESYKNIGWIKEILDLFDALVFSGPIGKVKPDAEIFHYLLDKYDLKAEECFFIDDSIINIEGAEKVGIKGYLFDSDVEKLREYLNLK